jgi:hypothetical protein
MIKFLKHKNRNYFQMGYSQRWNTWELGEFIKYEGDAEVIEHHSKRDVTGEVMLSFLKEREPQKGDIELLNRIIRAGGLVAYIKLLNENICVRSHVHQQITGPRKKRRVPKTLHEESSLTLPRSAVLEDLTKMLTF